MHRKEQIYRRRLVTKRHETHAFEEMIEDLEKANERLKDYYELYKGTGIHLDPEAIRRRRMEEPARIPVYRKNVYDSYARAYPSRREETPVKSLADQVLMKTMLREKGLRGDPIVGDETKRMRDKMEMLNMSVLGSKRLSDSKKVNLPKGAMLSGAKDKPEKLAMLKLLSQRTDGESTSSDEYDKETDSSSESESEDVSETRKRMRQEKYRKIKKMSDTLETIHGDSPKEFRDRRKRRQNIEMDKKNRNMGETVMKVDEITRRLKELEERSAKVIAQKSKIDDLIAQHKHEQADDSGSD